MTSSAPTTTPALLDQPHEIVERDGVRFTLLGTAHISKASVEVVEAEVASGAYDTIAIELDSNRLRALTEPDMLHKLDLFQIIREGKTGLVAANLALAAYQRRLAEQLGVEPGAELKAAALGAKKLDLGLVVIDRDVGTTLRRAWGKLGFWGRSKLMTGLAGSLFVNDQVEEGEIEKLKEGDMLESSFGEFAAQTPQLFEAVIAERDRYMAAKLRALIGNGSAREVLAVVGAGHLKGLAEHLRSDQEPTEAMLAELDTLPKKSRVPWFTLAITALFASAIAWGFWHGGAELGVGLLMQWLLATSLLAGLGCLLAGGHPLSILTAMIMAPLKPFHPGVPAGTFSAFVEAWLRRPTYADFLAVRDDASHFTGWWRNRVTRTLLNFLLTNIGTMIGVWIAGAAIIGKLI
ncbi:MAG TPA: TraB/GumN family protein [Arenimonas sp.]|uniref:TraB/GumN family protein n=1 Tax=Arenimonas sp. TaxID=1872635 RepID=UPI002BA81627|nr:TraB/GumN family protein [Arenimonas sp.]HMB57423.1 TraB/GumN family protein [Arenimonas sp.]